MDDHVYRVIEIVGTSQKGVDDAIKSAISRANATIRTHNHRPRNLAQSRAPWSWVPAIRVPRKSPGTLAQARYCQIGDFRGCPARGRQRSCSGVRALRHALAARK